jgi:hypothetical protein
MGWLLAASGYQETSLSRLALAGPIVEELSQGRWDTAWAVVDFIATADHVLMLTARSPGARAVLRADGVEGGFAPSTVEAIAESHGMAVELLMDGPTVVTCSFARVARWWSGRVAPADHRLWDDEPVIAHNDWLHVRYG